MVYNLLKRIQSLWASKSSRTKEELEILNLINQVLPTMLNGRDTEALAPNELLVRICPDTRQPTLVCHNGNGQCVCLHNDTVSEDAVDVELWLRSNGKDCNGGRKLLETVADLAYNAGADNLCGDKDSHTIIADIIERAIAFSNRHTETDWEIEDYILTIDKFYQEEVLGQLGKAAPSTVKCNNDKDMNDVLAAEKNCEIFIEILSSEISSDDNSCRHKARDLINAYRSQDCEGMLMALCGWSMETLLAKYKEYKENGNG